MILFFQSLCLVFSIFLSLFHFSHIPDIAYSSPSRLLNILFLDCPQLEKQNKIYENCVQSLSQWAIRKALELYGGPYNLLLIAWRCFGVLSWLLSVM